MGRCLYSFRDDNLIIASVSWRLCSRCARARLAVLRPAVADDQGRRWAAIAAKARAVSVESAPAVPRRGLITATIICACVMQGVDTTIANVALPHMQGSLSASQDQISWVLTSYIVSCAIMMPLTGWLASRFGVKYIFLASVIGFTLASALCGAATSLSELVLYLSCKACAGPDWCRWGRRRCSRYLPARAARLRHGDLQHGRDDGADHRPDPAAAG